MAVLLLQTLFCASGRVSTISGQASVSEDYVNTPAGTHDGSDATQDKGSAAGDGESIQPQLFYLVRYQLQPATTYGIIQFVRVKLRHYKFNDGGGTVSCQPTINGLGVGTPNTTPTSDFINASFDIATDAGQPWTNARVNSKTWGFTISIFGVNPGDSAAGSISELVVELWGVAVSGQSSYTSNRFDISQPIAERLPEESAAVARGDRRFMRQE